VLIYRGNGSYIGLNKDIYNGQLIEEITSYRTEPLLMIRMTLKGYFSYLDLVVDFISMIAINSIQ